MTESLYLHIPFCDHLCHYCDFPKVLKGTFSEDCYLDCLLKEIESFSIPDHSLKTIYIGGGTPSALSPDNLKKLLSYLYEHFFPVVEFTVEANPESLTEEKMVLMKTYGVNRISLGVESSNDRILSKLNRAHRITDVKRSVALLKHSGFDNINLDFIYGLEGTDLSDVKKDLDFALGQNVTHLSFYSLQIEEGTIFYNKNVKADDDSILANMYEEIVTTLSKNGFSRYEVSNFARTGYESKHNLTYWHDQEYYAAGLGASGYILDTRYINTKSMNRYLQGKTRASEDRISIQDHEFEYLMLHLRLVSGFSITEFNRLFSKDFLSYYRKGIQEVKDYVVVEDGFFKIRPEYLYTMDNILLSLLILPEDLS